MLYGRVTNFDFEEVGRMGQRAKGESGADEVSVTGSRRSTADGEGRTGSTVAAAARPPRARSSKAAAKPAARTPAKSTAAKSTPAKSTPAKSTPAKSPARKP